MTLRFRHFWQSISPHAAWLAFVVPLALYGLLLNPYWIRHGDSEVMVGIARSLRHGQGFRFNGQPIGVVPPGWPVVLAAAMSISRAFWFLKLITIFSLAGFLFFAYDVLAHWVPRRVALGCVIVAAFLQPVFVLATLQFSDPLFSLLAMGWLSVALRIRNTRYFLLMLAALIVLAIATLLVRWAGAAWMPLVIACIYHGQGNPRRMDRRALATVLTVIVTVTAFFVIRRMMYVDLTTIDPRYAVFKISTYNLLNIDSIVTQLAQFGLWLSGLFAAPLTWFKAIRFVAQIFGWVAFVVLVLGSVRAARKQFWLPAAATLYMAFLAATWPNPVARYLVPAAPLLLATAWEGICFTRRWHGPTIAAIAIVLINGVLYANDLIIMHVPNFYSHYQGGTNLTLIDAANKFLELDDGRPIQVAGRYVNFDKSYKSDGFRRALYFLTDRPVLCDEDVWGEPTPAVVRALRASGAGWYLYRPGTKLVMHTELSPPTADLAWRLYRVVDDSANHVRLPNKHSLLTRVPE